MSVTASQVKAIATEFSSTDDDTVTAAIVLAEERTNRTAWGVKADTSVIYLAAHLLKLDGLQSSAAVNPVSSETVGPISRSYAVHAEAGEDDLNSTIWGKRYKGLQSTLMVPRVF